MTLLDEECFDGAVGLPRGTVTFLLTDVEDSTPAWDRDPEAMAKAITRHYEILDEVIARHDGLRPVEQGEGDSVVAVFTSAADAVRAAADAQDALAAEAWPAGLALHVRMGLHTGEAELRDETNYMGQTIVRAARIRALAYGGQVLLSDATAALVRSTLANAGELIDRGVHQLTGLLDPEHVWEFATGGESRFADIRGATSSPRASSFPQPLTPFIGRVEDLAALTHALRASRLVTLNGVGGCGKTRLALEAARTVRDEFDDAAFVELATARDDAAVDGAIATAVGIASAGPELENVVRSLRGRQYLLVLDNCEQVLTAAARAAQVLTAQLPGLSILATSREPLMVPGETAWRVASLGADDAVLLFLDRAGRARTAHDYRQQLDLVSQICTRLDGIPLAIELAAARSAALPLTRLADGLDDRFRLLTGGARAAMPRQQTLQASVDWSYDLLTETERVTFRRLAVFSGGFTLDAAEAVLPDELLRTSDVMPAVMALADKSLVTLDEGDRYQLLETLRHYGGQKLIESDEASALRDRHLRWALDFIPHHTVYPGEPGWRGRNECVRELSNFEAALDWARDPGDIARAASHLARAGAWAGKGDVMVRAITRLAELPADALDVDTLINSLAVRVTVATERGEFRSLRAVTAQLGEIVDAGSNAFVRSGGQQALTFGRSDPHDPVRSVSLAREIGLPDRLAQALAVSASRASMRGEFDEAARAIEETEQLLRETPAAARLGVHAGNLDMAKQSLAIAGGNGALLQRRLERERQAPWDMPQITFDNPRPEFFRRTQLMIAALYLGEHDGVDPDAVAVLDAALRNGLGLARERGPILGVWTMMAADRLGGARAAIDAYVAAGNRPSSLMLGHDFALGMPVLQAYLALGALAAARDVRTETTTIARRREFRVEPFIAQLEAQLALVEGRPVDAEVLAHSALVEASAEGLLPTVARCFERLAVAASLQGQWAEAARLFGASQRVRDEALFRLLWPVERDLCDEGIAAARAAVGDEIYQAAFDEGLGLATHDAVAYAQRARGERKRPTLGWAALTPTERQVADLAAEGRTNKEIAAELLMGAETVKTHLSRIFAKVGAKNRTELAARR